MTDPTQGTPPATYGLRPRIRAMADDADGAFSPPAPQAGVPAPRTASPHAAAFAPYILRRFLISIVIKLLSSRMAVHLGQSIS